MILITGSTGHFGKATIEFLLQNGVAANQISGLARSAEKAKDLQEKGIRIIEGNYNDYDSLVQAFKGVEKLLLVSSSDIPNRLVQQENVVKAAKEAGVQHIVYTSFGRRNETESSPLWVIAQSHLNTEKVIKESGLAYTILKNNLYLDYVPLFIGGEKVVETGIIYFPAGEGRLSAALRSEMAEAAAKVLSSEGHENKVYDLVNTEAFSYEEVAKYLTEITGKEIKYVSPSKEEFIKTLTEAGAPAEMANVSAGFAVAQSEGDLDTVSDDLQNLIGRKPTGIKEFLTLVYKK